MSNSEKKKNNMSQTPAAKFQQARKKAFKGFAKKTVLRGLLIGLPIYFFIRRTIGAIYCAILIGIQISLVISYWPRREHYHDMIIKGNPKYIDRDIKFGPIASVILMLVTWNTCNAYWQAALCGFPLLMTWGDCRDAYTVPDDYRPK